MTLYVLLAGRPPFTGESLPKVCADIFNATPVRLDELDPGIPREVADVVARCLEKDRERRFPDVRSLAEALAPFRAASAVSVFPSGPHRRVLDSVTLSAPAVEGRPKARRPRRIIAACVAAGVVVLAAGAHRVIVARDAARVAAPTEATSASATSEPASEPSAEVAPDPVGSSSKTTRSRPSSKPKTHAAVPTTPPPSPTASSPRRDPNSYR